MAHARTSTPPFGRRGRFEGLQAALAKAMVAARRGFKIWHGRRVVYRLGTLDDRMLQDVGLTRADLQWAEMQPWNVDVTEALSERVARRREAAQWGRRHERSTAI